MARDNVAITTLGVNAGTAPAAGTSIVVANGAVIPAGGNTQKLVVYVTNTDTAAHTVTVKAGVNPPAFRAEMGDLVVSVPNAAGRYLVLESARFAQANGDIYIDFAAGSAGIIAAYRLAADV